MDIVIAAGVFVAIALIYPCYVAHRRMKAEWEANRVVQPAMTEQAIRMQQKGAARLDALEGGHHQGAAGPHNQADEELPETDAKLLESLGFCHRIGAYSSVKRQGVSCEAFVQTLSGTWFCWATAATVRRH